MRYTLFLTFLSPRYPISPLFSNALSLLLVQRPRSTPAHNNNCKYSLHNTVRVLRASCLPPPLPLKNCLCCSCERYCWPDCLGTSLTAMPIAVEHNIGYHNMVQLAVTERATCSMEHSRSLVYRLALCMLNTQCKTGCARLSEINSDYFKKNSINRVYL